MMKRFLYILMLCATGMAIACSGEQKNEAGIDEALMCDFSDDKTIYGLACEGCTDSVICLLPTDGSNPVMYNIIDAARNRKVMGKIKIGDYLGIVLNANDSTVADMVIDIDHLKGTWCYVVMPKMKALHKMSPKSQQRFMNGMPDSLREELFVPREYGFTIKSHYQASSVGLVGHANALEEESPVVYDKVPNYIMWHLLNGKLVLMRQENVMSAAGDDKKVKPTIKNDTADIIYMMDDSLVLRFNNHMQSFYRVSSAESANKIAREQAERKAKEAAKAVTEESSEKVEAVHREKDKK